MVNVQVSVNGSGEFRPLLLFRCDAMTEFSFDFYEAFD